jgi:hypothetical protein
MRTVILACSATKRRDTAELAAIARYDGPAWRVLRAHMTCAIAPPFALSAEFGLISAYQEIPNYDRRMTPDAGAGAHRSRRRATRGADPREASSTPPARSSPLAAAPIEPCSRTRAISLNASSAAIPITFTTGGIGEQLGQLKQWLITAPSPAEQAIADNETAAIVSFAAARSPSSRKRFGSSSPGAITPRDRVTIATASAR